MADVLQWKIVKNEHRINHKGHSISCVPYVGVKRMGIYMKHLPRSVARVKH